MKNMVDSGDKDMGSAMLPETPTRRLIMLDAFTAPFRWVLSVVLAIVAPHFSVAIAEEPEKIMRRLIGQCIDELGFPYTEQQFNELLDRKLDELYEQNRREHRLLSMLTVTSGFIAKDALWTYCYEDVAIRKYKTSEMS